MGDRGCDTALMHGPIGAITVVACIALAAACGGGSGHHTTTRPRSSSASTVAPSTTTTAVAITYQVKRGDTLASIAARFRVSIATIVFVNRLADPNHVTEGQVLHIPPAPPLALVITPPQGQVGASFQLGVKGAKPTESITFEIDSPTGKFTGRPHLVASDGSVAATYQTSSGDPTGTYKVVATGTQGTTLQATFQVAASGK